MQHGSGLLLNAYNTNNVRLNVSVTHPIHSAMRSSSSQSYTPEPSPSRKNKMQSQREYRSKEMVGFSELRDALLLVDPFDTPLGRDATRHQLLITAAKKLRNLADENQKLAFQLSAMPNSGSHEPELGVRSSCGMTSQNTGDAWSTQKYGVEYSRSMAAEPVPPHRDYENTPGWAHSPPPFYGHGHRPYGMALGSTCQGLQ
ncbi:hypothetical protein V8E55_011765 [Tylopilus felleus]